MISCGKYGSDYNGNVVQTFQPIKTFKWLCDDVVINKGYVDHFLKGKVYDT